MSTDQETVFGACIECRQVGEMKRRNGFLAHNKLGTDIECEHSGLELKGYGALSGDPVSEYLAKFAEEENAGRVSYHGSKSEKALGVWTDIADVLDYSFTSQQVRACVSAIAAALEAERLEERKACAKILMQHSGRFLRQFHEADRISLELGRVVAEVRNWAAAIRSRETDNE
jgi:hypothetical protein